VTDLQRLRIAGLDVPSPARGRSSGAAPAFLGKVVSVAANLGVGKFFMASPATVTGPEAEGGAGAVADSTPKVPVYLLGPGVPATGDYLICRFVDYRWVAERGGGGGAVGPPPIVLQSCFCPVPAALKMTSANPGCNYGMFNSCTITYQATPDWAAGLGLGPMIFLSDEKFLDSNSQSYFYYYMWCQYNQFSLTRLYPTSPYGSPYRDALLYSWLLGSYGNVCDPFRLDGGKPYPGSDQSCLVMIDPA